MRGFIHVCVTRSRRVRGCTVTRGFIHVCMKRSRHVRRCTVMRGFIHVSIGYTAFQEEASVNECTMFTQIIEGWPKPYICTVHDRILVISLPKIPPYIYGSGQPYR
jgi:hypothetical protein